MERNRVLMLGMAVLFTLTLACNLDTVTTLVARATTTPTSTRTPRPTFTPYHTATPEPTSTPEATATRAPSFTPTTRAVATARPATKAPTAPPAPQFVWRRGDNLDKQGMCPAGPGTFEVKGRIYSNALKAYVGGVHIIALDNSGKVIARMDSLYPQQLNPEWGVNCRESKNMFNYQLDVAAGRGNQPITIRIVRSSADLTPISPDVTIQFGPEGGRYYLDWVTP